MVDFSFVYDELKDKYSSTMGRNAEDVIRMFKYLLLENYYKLSDRDLIARTKTVEIALEKGVIEVKNKMRKKCKIMDRYIHKFCDFFNLNKKIVN